MAITKEQKQEITKKFGKDNDDTGNSKVQIAILSHALKNLPSI